jgi:cytochrome c oxidase subunit 2
MNWLPPRASTFAGEIDFMFWVILIITGTAFVIVEGGLLWFLIRYRHQPDRRAHYTHGSMRAEIVWTTIPAVTVIVLGVWSGRVWSEIKRRDRLPEDAVRVAVAAKQFEWNVTYAGADGALGTDDDFTVRNQLHVPVNRPVVADLTSEDAIHSFFVPAFRLKQDAVPGMRIPVWFQATEVGQYELACAELCGNSHYRMRGMVYVHTQEDYDQWMLARAAGGEGR